MVVTGWTGNSACALQSALRMSRETFAAKLGVSSRTVARWHDSPELSPRPEIQAALDTMLEQAPDGVRARFDELTVVAAPRDGTAESLRVAIAVVTDDDHVLLVCRRESSGSLRWQFPAGMVKPGAVSSETAARETLAETGVHVTVREQLGARLHPITHVHCDYWACDYLTGTAENRDPVENLDVVWAPIPNLERFIPLENIYAPILTALEASRDHQ